MANNQNRDIEDMRRRVNDKSAGGDDTCLTIMCRLISLQG